MKNLLEFFPLARQKSVTEFCGPCPSCGGDDRFIVWPQRGDTGRYHCRQCGIGGDGIAFLMQFHSLTYPEACATLGVAPRDKRGFHKATASQVTTTRPKETQAELPPASWSTAATALLADCQAAFLKSSEAVAAICAQRYIGERAAISCGLGWHSRDEYFTREAWGSLEIEGKKKIIVPRGLVIATKRNGKVIALTIRCTDDRPKDRPKYWQVAGSGRVPFIVGKTGTPVILTESALDAVLIRQESENTVAAVAVMGASKGFDEQSADFIRKAQCIIACPDNDEAGHKAWERWRSEFPKAVRIAPVGAKDLTEMHALATTQHMRGEQRTAPFVAQWLSIALKIA